MTQKAKKQIAYTLATHAVERLTPSQEAIRYCEQVSNGTLSADQAMEKLLKRHGAGIEKMNQE